jgi:glycosyltransferase involved in cell wall biosynthesis
MIHEAIGKKNAIARVSANGVWEALKAGWRVTVVAKFLDEDLRDEVEWLKLTVPPRLFFVQWVTARHFIKQALGGRTFDVVHAHQPQVAALSDIFQCHYLTRVAFERKCLESRPGLRPAFIRAQQRGVLAVEDHYYRHWNPRTKMLFTSEMMRREFGRLYGMPADEAVLVSAPPPLHFVSEQERREARKFYVGDHPGPVVGYLGGLHERKGYRRLIQALEGDNAVFLLMGGPYSEGFTAPSLAGRFKSVGRLVDTNPFYAACDVFIVPSLFEPLGLVAFEAASRGIPVIATEEVGALPHLLEYGAGAAWKVDQPLVPLICAMAARREACRRGAEKMRADLCEARYGERLIGYYEQVLREKRAYPQPPS